MTPEVAAVTWVGVAAMIAVAVAVLRVLPGLQGTGGRLLALSVVVGGETVVLGLVTGAARAPYLVDLASAAAVVMALLLAAADAAGAGPGRRWLVPVVWGVVVLPVTALGPLLVTAGCTGLPCELQDFGGALPLALGPAVVALGALLLPRGARRGLPALSTGASVLLGATVWAASVLWIAAMEGALDAYTPTLLIAGAVGPAVGAAIWLLIDVLRRADRPVARSLALGAMVGMVATLAGAATVAPPFSLAVSALGTAIAAGVAGRSTSSVPRAGGAVLAAAFVGLLAPVVSGDAVGVLFTAQIDALPVPVEAAAAVAAAAAVLSIPVWLALRYAGGRRVGRRPVSRRGRAPRSP